MRFVILGVALALLSSAALAQSLSAADAAAKFGARENVSSVSISPDGTKVAYITPRSGQGNALYTVDLASGAARLATAADGNPLRLRNCRWVANDRLLCALLSYQKGAGEIVIASRLIAMDADGGNLKLLSQLPGSRSIGWTEDGGDIVDYLPDEDGSVLMGRVFVPEGRIGSLIEKRDEGFGIEKIDTRTGRTTAFEEPKREAAEYITDGRGVVRIMGVQPLKGDGYHHETINYRYRLTGEKGWQPLSSYNILTRDGFEPYAVDAEKNVAFGFKKKNGRLALYSVALDGSRAETMLFEHPQVDVDGLLRVGRQRKVVGATYAVDARRAHYFDAEFEKLDTSLGRAVRLPQSDIIDASLDMSRLLMRAGSDTDPGSYYVFDRAAKRLNKILLARPALEGVKLATVKPITYRASDGTMVPGYLTMPPDGTAKNLPAIVLPHGGPEARDEWGFDWLAQFYANRGYAVLQPNFRGSTGYGDTWFQKNGFQSWRAAVGDVVDAGRWLVSEGIADAKKLGVVGWSYGGYAALQSGVIAPDVFKAIVAIAPVTDFRMTIDESKGYSNYLIERERVGSGPHIREGSPAQNASAIQVPVLLVHGDYDRNVEISQSRFMEDKLKGAGKRVELMVFPGLDHSLDDSAARAQMLKRSDDFLRASMGM